jgi:hypothetical protein
MASTKTACKALKVITRLVQVFGPEMRPPFQTGFNQEGKIFTKGPGTMGKIYRELPRETLLRFIIPTNTPEPEPTKKEWQEFENKLFTTARRVTIRQVREKFKKLSKGLPEPQKQKRGRPARKESHIKAVQKTVQKYLDSGVCKTKTEAVRKAAEALAYGRGANYCEDTIWRCLRAASQAKRARPRSASRKSQRPSAPRVR